jgi:hypothetical protein
MGPIKTKGPLVRYAIWYGDWEWTVIARERVGGKELAVTSAQFSIPRDPPEGYAKAPNCTNLRELEPA